MRKIIQTFKSSDDWINSPPGLGDFIRGTCHLFELLAGTNVELRIDISQTEFSSLIEFDANVFHIGERDKIAAAREFFTDHQALLEEIAIFVSSEESTFYVSTNLGNWNRVKLPEATRNYIERFYRFSDEIRTACNALVQDRSYEVLSIRAGDDFYGSEKADLEPDIKNCIYSLIEKKVIPHSRHPIIIMSDSHRLKHELAEKFGFIVFPHVPQHGGRGGGFAVAMDMNLLANSLYIYHINAWQTWWSGFSHYTSIIFRIPSVNFRSPEFLCEMITSDGIVTSHKSLGLRARQLCRQLLKAAKGARDALQ